VNPLVIQGGMLGLTLIARTLSQSVVAGALLGSVAAEPLWLQVVAVTLLADLAFYLVHRLFHRVPWLWNFTAVHHSIAEMDWLAAARVHPLDQF
jgi:sterol desaturase/sphingolipid hydroxylase (fatty acid hydroxylase superfamily)